MFSGRRRSRQLRGVYDDFVNSQDDMLAWSLEGAHRDRVPIHRDDCILMYVSDFGCLC